MGGRSRSRARRARAPRCARARLPVASGAEADRASRGTAARGALPSGARAAAARAASSWSTTTRSTASVLVKQVAALGYAAEQVGDGEEALRMWRSHDYALVLADCQMPGMDGFAFARAVRPRKPRRPAARVPIVAWTANVMPDDVDACLAPGWTTCWPSRPPCRPSSACSRPGSTRPADRPDGASPADESAADRRQHPIDREQLRLIMNGDPALEPRCSTGSATARSREALPRRGDGRARMRPRPQRRASPEGPGAARRRPVPGRRLRGNRGQAKAGCVDERGSSLAAFDREWDRVSQYLNAGTPTYPQPSESTGAHHPSACCGLISDRGWIVASGSRAEGRFRGQTD